MLLLHVQASNKYERAESPSSFHSECGINILQVVEQQEYKRTTCSSYKFWL